MKKIDDLSTAFISDYREFKLAFPESKTPWTIDMKGEITFESEQLISYRLALNSYTGGAHMNAETFLFNVNKNGKKVGLKSFITNRKKFIQIAEKAFRKSKSLSLTADLGEAGFTFDKNKFQLPENIGFTQKGVVLFYNDYEIATYADGPTEINISYKELEGVISI